MSKDSMLASGWGIVHDEHGAHWVYVPLLDPVKFNEVGRAFFITMIIKQHLRAITDAKAKSLLAGIIKEQAKVVEGGFLKAMDADDDWCCTKYPVHFNGGTGPVGPDPDNPVYRETLGKEGSAKLNAKVAITMLGKTFKNARIMEAAEMI
jgi:hypothetical protein